MINLIGDEQKIGSIFYKAAYGYVCRVEFHVLPISHDTEKFILRFVGEGADDSRGMFYFFVHGRPLHSGEIDTADDITAFIAYHGTEEDEVFPLRACLSEHLGHNIVRVRLRLGEADNLSGS